MLAVSRVLQFVVFLCKLGLLILITLSGIDKFKQGKQKRNEAESFWSNDVIVKMAYSKNPELRTYIFRSQPKQVLI